MENRIEESAIEQIEKRLGRLEDRAAIENLVAKHNFYYSSGQGRRIVPELWTADEKASVEYGASGVYGELWKVKTFYVNFERRGCFATFTSANQWLHIAEDGMSAHGVWMVVGTETDAGDFGRDKPGQEDQRRILYSSYAEQIGGYKAEILLQNHEIRFVKEEGKWKIHDLHISEYFRFPAGSDWVQFAKIRQITDGMWLEEKFETPDPIPSWENLPSKATTYHWQYDTDNMPEWHIELKEES